MDIIHKAGQPDLEACVQRCTRCGIVLVDNTGMLHIILASEGAPALGWYQPGASVELTICPVHKKVVSSGITPEEPNCLMGAG